VDANSQYLEDLLHCSLINFDKSGTTQNYLAESFQWTSPTELAVKIKSGIKFADGTIVTPSDVVATYQFFLKKDVSPPSPRASAFRLLQSITSDAQGQIIFKLKEADATLVTNLVIGVLPQKQAQKAKPLEDELGTPGCGPYTVTEKNMGGLILKANPHFSLGDVSKSETIEIKIVKDESTRFAKLRRGEVDIVQNSLGRDKLSQIARKFPNLAVQQEPALKTSYLGFNMNDPLLAKVEVRQAIGMAIDRESIIKFILGGLATPAKTLLTPQDPFLSDSLKDQIYDPVAAEKLLEQAGFKSKPRLSLTLKTSQDMTRISIAKAIASQLQKIGIKVTVQPLEWGRFKADIEQGNVQMWTLTWIGFKDPDIYRYVFASSNFAPNGGNNGRYSNRTLDILMEKGRMETDFSKRRAIYEQVQSIVAADLPYVFLWHEDNFAVLSQKIKGFEIFADGRFSALRTTYKH
jgi:peptide/nickel transport system substrate-binding protein